MAFDAISEILPVNIADPILRQDRVAFPGEKTAFDEEIQLPTEVASTLKLCRLLIIMGIFGLSVHTRDIREQANNFDESEGFELMIDKMMKGLN